MELRSCEGLLTAHQPNLFPRLKVLHKIVQADCWVILDDVQFVPREWQNRVRASFLLQPDLTFWITIPVGQSPRYRSTISGIKICNYLEARRKILRSIECSYRRSPYWTWIDEYLKAVLTEKPISGLREVAVRSAVQCLARLEIRTNYVFSSTLKAKGKGSLRLVDICKKMKATNYLSGSGGKSYIDENAFRKAGISLYWQQWHIEPNMNGSCVRWRNITFIDFVARFGPDRLRDHLLNSPGIR
jgi:hypothetical protein